MECSPRPIGGEITSEPTPPSQMECSPRPIGGEITSETTLPQPDGMFASSNEGGHRSPDAPRPIQRRVTSERIPPPARGRDKKGGELSQGGLVFFGVPWWSVVVLVLVVVVVVAEVFRGARVVDRHSWQPGSLVGFWVVGSSPTVVGCVGALELGIPIPVHGLRAPQVQVGKIARGTRPDSDPQLAFHPELKGRIKTHEVHFFLGVFVCLWPV